MTAAREPWLKPIAFAMLCFAAPEGTAPLTKDQGLPPSQALKSLSFRGVASKLPAARLGHGVTVADRSRAPFARRQPRTEARGCHPGSRAPRVPADSRQSTRGDASGHREASLC